MLSLETCRKILGSDAPVDDHELAEQREEAYRLARLLIEVFLAQKTSKKVTARLTGDAEE
ncbi:MAG TPA: hypothetical protein VMW27_20720 [Thermoanaerobaculia bacterium]|nr:hypothetical protein [Thermoanaerobaculia bacterium]